MKKPEITEGNWSSFVISKVYESDECDGVIQSMRFFIEPNPDSLDTICQTEVDASDGASAMEEAQSNFIAISAVPEMIDALIRAKEMIEGEWGHCPEWLMSALKKAGCTDD